jgi:hypothetical protein
VTSNEASTSIAGSCDVALTVRDVAAVARFGGGRVRCNGEEVS